MLVATLLLGAIVVSASGALWWSRPWNARKAEFNVFRCAECGQKLRYRASKAGHAGMCPRCGQHWTLPRDPQAPASALRSCDDYQVRIGQRRILVSRRRPAARF